MINYFKKKNLSSLNSTYPELSLRNRLVGGKRRNADVMLLL